MSTEPTSEAISQDPIAYLLGLQGIALMRAFAGEYDQAFVERRITEIADLLAERSALGAPGTVAPFTVADGYDVWAESYDSEENPLLEVDARQIRGMLGERQPAAVLDAACGTGRHAAWFAQRGATVVGVDTSPGMLARAAERVPAADFRLGTVSELPVADASVDLVVCTLALVHVADLVPVYSEFARVLRPGGFVLVSDTHSFFPTARKYPLIKQHQDGRIGYLPSWQHTVAEHVIAGQQSGFALRRAVEDRLGAFVDPGRSRDELSPDEHPDPFRLHSWAPEAANATYQGMPFAYWLEFAPA
ncbi:class I SAM-dependent methyltransferase [Microlunatus sp. Y2014]|uniref:class I SAM-dependent methyltransferase n=1 Tax=Microlunatus sp. Y2014 TaxID=3418488 RepID=UPI003DA6F4D9